IRVGKRAYGAARTPAQRYEAATLVAQAMATKGQHTGAKFWLRRAAQNAPTERYRKAAEQNHRIVARNAPLAFRFTVSVSPTSNVNNGSRHDTILIFGLPFTLSGASQALSGTEAIFGISGDYRIAATARSTTELRFGAVSRLVTLSDKAKVLAPEVRAGDFTFTAVETGIAHRFRTGAAPLVWTMGATAGHSWYGGRDLADYLRLDAGSELALAPTRSLKFSASAARQWRQDLATRSADVLSLGADVGQVLANGDRLTLGVSLSDTASQAPDIDHTALRAQFDWRQGQSVAGIRLGANFSAQSARYGVVALAPQGRNDLRLGAEVSATFENLDY
ncbi:MAG: hypothetical protein U1D06_09870, partial [Paracoccaceae bacterium]|nr:hypothetical protein [Paracoccaceae bacterium]